MTEEARLAAIEAIKHLKARYFRGVDKGDPALVRSILAEDCVLDYMGCCTDPGSGRDFLPQMNVVMRGRESWAGDAFGQAGIVSVHQGHNAEIDILSDTEATGTWSMTDRMWFPEGWPFSWLVGYGHYHDTYVKTAEGWLLKTTRISRIRIEVG